METAPFAPIFQISGPFATAFVDVSRDSENAEQEHELRVRTACEQLAEQGADETTVAAVRERLAEAVDRPAPVGRMVVARTTGTRPCSRRFGRRCSPSWSSAGWR